MPSQSSNPRTLAKYILPAWRTNARVTADLVRAIPLHMYRARIPGLPRRTVRMMAVHLHNSRCGWIRTLGQPLGVPVPERLDAMSTTRAALVRSLRGSARSMEAMFALACEHGGDLPPTRRYVWRNLALDAGHLLTYFVGHEAHHRGQLLLIARQLGAPFPKRVAERTWWWKPVPPQAKRGARA